MPQGRRPGGRRAISEPRSVDPCLKIQRVSSSSEAFIGRGDQRTPSLQPIPYRPSELLVLLHSKCVVPSHRPVRCTRSARRAGSSSPPSTRRSKPNGAGPTTTPSQPATRRCGRQRRRCRLQGVWVEGGREGGVRQEEGRIGEAGTESRSARIFFMFSRLPSAAPPPSSNSETFRSNGAQILRTGRSRARERPPFSPFKSWTAYQW